MFSRFGTGMTVPNGSDNGFYMSTDPIMVMETNNHLRGFLPGLVVPYGSTSAWHRKNFTNLPALPGKIVRFIQATYAENAVNAAPTLAGFDLTGPWR